MATKSRNFLLAMAAFWLCFGLGTIFYPRIMQLFMTPEGIAASTPFSDQVWLHGGMDILSVCLLLFALSAGSCLPRVRSIRLLDCPTDSRRALNLPRLRIRTVHHCCIRARFIARYTG